MDEQVDEESIGNVNDGDAGLMDDSSSGGPLALEKKDSLSKGINNVLSSKSRDNGSVPLEETEFNHVQNVDLEYSSESEVAKSSNDIEMNATDQLQLNLEQRQTLESSENSNIECQAVKNEDVLLDEANIKIDKSLTDSDFEVDNAEKGEVGGKIDNADISKVDIELDTSEKGNGPIDIEMNCAENGSADLEIDSASSPKAVDELSKKLDTDVEQHSSENRSAEDKIDSEEKDKICFEKGSAAKENVNLKNDISETVDVELAIESDTAVKFDSELNVTGHDETKMDVDENSALISEQEITGVSAYDENSCGESGDFVGDLMESHESLSIPSDEIVYATGTAIYESDNSFKCQQCGTYYDNSEEFQEHVVGHLVQNSLTDDSMGADDWSTCPICLQMFPEFSLYEEHLKNHLNNIFKCTVCNKTFRERKELEDHVAKIHNMDRPFQCSVCNKMLKTVRTLASHLRKSHGKMMPFGCDFCPFSTLTVEDLDCHVKRDHPNKKAKKRQRQFTCEVCSRIYFSKEEFKKHKQEGHTSNSVISVPVVGTHSVISVPVGETISMSQSMVPQSVSMESKESSLDAVIGQTVKSEYQPGKGQLGDTEQKLGLSEEMEPKQGPPEEKEPKRRSSGEKEPKRRSSEEKEPKRRPSKEKEPKRKSSEEKEQGQGTSEDGSLTGDDGTPSKRRRSRRITYLESLVHGCRLCSNRYATVQECEDHLKERHNAIINDYGDIVYLTKLDNEIKRRKTSTSTPERKSRVQQLKEDDTGSSDSTPRDSPVASDKEEEDPSYEPDPSSDEDYAPPGLTKPKTSTPVKSKPISTDNKNRFVQGQSMMRSWDCNICYLTFPTLVTLKEHFLQKHLKEIKKMHGTCLCPYCPKTFITEDLVHKHIGYYHSLKELMADGSKPVAPDVLRMLACNICGQQYLGEHRLKNHRIQKHSGQRRYTCHLCKETFLQMDILLSHISKAHDQNKTAITSTSRPTSKTPDISNTTSSTGNQDKSDLNSQYAKKFYYACSVCEEGFNRESDLEDHIVSIHRLAMAPNRCEKKPYGCFMCDKRFMQLNAITLHLVFHHQLDENDIMGGRQKKPEQEGEQNHQCLICQQWFSKKKFLDRHAQQNNCSPETVTQPNRPRKRRFIVHSDGEKPLDCPKCTGKYWGKAYLYLHIIESHSNEVLGEILLKKKIEDAANEDFEDDTAEEENPFPVALYAAGAKPATRKPPRGGFLPARNPCPPTSISAASRTASPDIIDLTDDDPVDIDHIPKLSIIRRPPAGPVRSYSIAAGQVRTQYHPNGQQRHALQNPNVHMNHQNQPRTMGQMGVTSGFRSNTNFHMNRQNQPRTMGQMGVTSGIRSNTNQIVRTDVRQGLTQVTSRGAQPTGLINQSNQFSSRQQSQQCRNTSNLQVANRRPNISASSGSAVPHGSGYRVATGQRWVASATTLGRPRSGPQEVLNQPRVQSISLAPVKSMNGQKVSAVVDLTEDSDEEIVDVAPILPSQTNDTTIKCIHCPEAFSEPLQMLIHVYSVHVKHNPYVCAFCNETITDRRALQEHIQTHEQFKMIKSAIRSNDALSLKLPFSVDEVSMSGLEASNPTDNGDDDVIIL